MAGSLMQPQYAQNSGALGSLAMMAQAYAGKKLRGKAEGREADALKRGSEASALLEEAKAAREQNRKIKEQQDKVAAVRAAYESGDVATLAALGVTIPKEEKYKPDWRERTKADGSTEFFDINAYQPQQAQQGSGSYRDAIASIESAGSGDYKALGPQTRTGDRAYGRYQVMGANIPEWTKAALGREMTPEEFLSSPEAQDAVFDHRFGGYVQKYGPEGAAKAWFAGEGGMKNPNARDGLGTSVADYASKFTKNMGGMQEDYRQTASVGMPATIPGDAPKPKEEKPSTIQQRQRDLAEMKAAGVPLTNGMAQFYLANGKMPEAPKPAGAGGNKLSGESANKVGLYDNAIRAAKAWHDIVAERDKAGKPTGGYNNLAAMSPRAQSLLMQAIRAKLRAESGATISEDEIDGEVERYGARLMGGDVTDIQNANALLLDLVQQRKLLMGGNDQPAKPANSDDDLIRKYL